MSLRRVALWGFVGGATLPVLTVLAAGGLRFIPAATLLTSSLVAVALGSSIAAATILIARRAPELPAERARRELLSS